MTFPERESVLAVPAEKPRESYGQEDRSLPSPPRGPKLLTHGDAVEMPGIGQRVGALVEGGYVATAGGGRTSGRLPGSQGRRAVLGAEGRKGSLEERQGGRRRRRVQLRSGGHAERADA